MQKRCMWRIVYVCMFAQILTVVVVVGIAMTSSNQAKWELKQLCDSKIIRPIKTDDSKKPKAFVTLITDTPKKENKLSNYAESAVVMLHTLRKLHGNKYRYVAMVTHGVSQRIITALQNLNFTIEVVEKIKPPHAINGPDRWMDTYTKLWAWGLEEYSSIAYIDADHLVLKPLDALFDYRELGAVSRGGSKFSAGLMVLQPNIKTMRALFEAMKFPQCHSHKEMDQSFLNWYFSDWTEIPRAYSVNDVYDETPRFEEFKAIHGKFFDGANNKCTKCVQIFKQQLKEVPLT